MRRTFLLGMIGAMGGLMALSSDSSANPWRRERRRVRRRVRRRMRRMRRHAFWRMHAGRRLLIVPVGVAAGWELMVDNRMATVQTVQNNQVVVRYSDDNSVATVPCSMENNDQNSQVLPGTEYEAEVEEEVEG